MLELLDAPLALANLFIGRILLAFAGKHFGIGFVAVLFVPSTQARRRDAVFFGHLDGRPT